MLSSGCDVDECRVLLPERIRIALRHLSAWGIRIALRRLFLLGSPDSIAAHVLLGNSNGVEPDGSLHLTHADGPPCDIRISHPKLCPVGHVRIL